MRKVYDMGGPAADVTTYGSEESTTESTKTSGTETI